MEDAMRSRHSVIILMLCVAGAAACGALGASVAVPNPTIDEPLAPAGAERVAVLAGGCFWGIEAVFEHVKGVKNVVSGYSGGAASTAQYETVSTGRTGHAESVKITYDPSKISYGQLLKVFFSVAHDPTELNRQGPDTGTQYRSVIFVANEEQRRIATNYIAEINKAKLFGRPLATEIVPLQAFYDAEAYHQDYLVHHPDQPYIVINDKPKIESLRKQLPDLYVAK
jgi:peptide-methionine (S)-S-oxide reductase